MSHLRHGRHEPAQASPPLTELLDARLARAGVRLLLKRDDLIHPLLPGNKWRKLQHNLTRAAELGHETLLTFGGAYSNHVRAVAAAGPLCGFQTIGVIRGEEHQPLNDVLTFAADCGMRLTYMDRATYRAKDTVPVIDALRQEFGPFYLLPEGGSNELAVRGCAELPAEIDVPFDVICCPVGTGGTLAGIAAGLNVGQRALGFSILKGGQFLADDVARLQAATYGEVSANWSIAYDFHAGGYAKRSPELDTFIDDFAERHAMLLEWVYVAKMMWGIFTMVEQGTFMPGTVIVAVVTGPMKTGSE
ncbi:pyridoxal-phosphate dependent enzyme [Streptosporangium sp. NBC_01639]|uniref:1-aminocyclopropane-1-carboxylate deaminase/D-cysteine desulfhydrase n=1 Tax=Streptosporangium sp. NBC_01639 TaxID=2975948 RepID=UPI00386FDD51|nr:pyridoxal-phosphate dependent enzyme [Streptosporangium sp. NBC_01639]